MYFSIQKLCYDRASQCLALQILQPPSLGLSCWYRNGKPTKKKDVLAFYLFKQGFFEQISITSWNKTSSGKLLDLTEPRSCSGLQFQLCYRVKYHSNN